MRISLIAAATASRPSPASARPATASANGCRPRCGAAPARRAPPPPSATHRLHAPATASRARIRAVRRVVVHHEHATSASIAMSIATRLWPAATAPAGEARREQKVLPRPTSLSTRCARPSARRGGPRSPGPGRCRRTARGRASACVKASKIARCFSGGMPMPVSVTDDSQRHVAASLRLASRTCTTHLALLGELDGVADQVDQDLTQTRRGRPASASGTSCGIWQASSSPFWCARRPSAFTVSPSVSRRSKSIVSKLQLARLDLGEVQDVVDDRQQRVRRALDACPGTRAAPA